MNIQTPKSNKQSNLTWQQNPEYKQRKERFGVIILLQLQTELVESGEEMRWRIKFGHSDDQKEQRKHGRQAKRIRLGEQ